MWQRSAEAQERGRTETGPETEVVKAPRAGFGVVGGFTGYRVERREAGLPNQNT